LALAFAAGLMQDALSAAPFGVSALAYGVAAVLMTSLREALDRDLPWIQLGAGALASIAASIIPMFMVGISFGAVVKMLLVASISGAFTVMLFFALDYSRMVWGNA
jgi:cell shape-determining protein MreD